MRRSRTTGLIVFAIVASACLGTTTAPGTTVAPSTSATTETTQTTGLERALTLVDCEAAPASVVIVCEAYDLIKENYVDDVADDRLAAAALRMVGSLSASDTGDEFVCALAIDDLETSCRAASVAGLDSDEAAEAMVTGFTTHALDPNSAYFDVASLALLDEEQEGEIEGIGALVSPEDETLEGENKQCTIVSATCRILIVSTIQGAPADLAGLRRDDAIVGVDGEQLDGWSIDEVTAAVRGQPGTSVVLTIERAGSRFDVELERAAVTIPVIDQEVIGDVGYIHLHVFSENADEQFETAIADLLAEGVTRLVVDFRDNPGGLLDTAIEVTSAFLGDGDVVVTQGPDSSISYPVTGAVIVPEDLEVVLVVNKGSASASEVVAAVLQEAGRVRVVGENTFGKNTVQQRFGLSNGGALKLTIARWLTPGGLDFGGVGVAPDVELSFEAGVDPAELVAAVLEAA